MDRLSCWLAGWHPRRSVMSSLESIVSVCVNYVCVCLDGRAPRSCAAPRARRRRSTPRCTVRQRLPRALPRHSHSRLIVKLISSSSAPRDLKPCTVLGHAGYRGGGGGGGGGGGSAATQSAAGSRGAAAYYSPRSPRSAAKLSPLASPIARHPLSVPRSPRVCAPYEIDGRSSYLRNETSKHF